MKLLRGIILWSSRYWLRALLIMVPLAALLWAARLALSPCSGSGNPGWLESLGLGTYYALQFLVLNKDAPLGLCERAPDWLPFISWGLLLLSIAIPVFVSSGVIKALFDKRLQPVLVRLGVVKATGHIVIVGGGTIGRALVEAHLDHDKEEKPNWRGTTTSALSKKPICVVELEGYNEYYWDLAGRKKAGRVLWLGADARRGSHFKKLRGTHARRIYLTAGDDELNLSLLDVLFAKKELVNNQSIWVRPFSLHSIVSLLDVLFAKGKEAPPEVLVHLEDSAKRDVLEQSLIFHRGETGDRAPTFWVRPFSLYSIAARRLFLQHWPVECSSSSRAYFLVIGESRLAEELIVEIARLARYDPDPQCRTRLRWVSPENSVCRERVLSRYRCLDPDAKPEDFGDARNRKHPASDSFFPPIDVDFKMLPREEFTKPDVLRRSLLRWEDALPQRVFVCEDSQTWNIWAARVISRELGRMANDSQPPPVRRETHVIATVFHVEDTELASNRPAESHLLKEFTNGKKPLHAFHVLRSAIDFTVDDMSSDMAAMLLVRAYALMYGNSGASDEEGKQNWTTLVKTTLEKTDYDKRMFDALAYNPKEKKDYDSTAKRESFDRLLRSSWASVADEERWANRDVVDHLPIKLAYVLNRARNPSAAAADHDTAKNRDDLECLIRLLASSVPLPEKFERDDFEHLLDWLSKELDHDKDNLLKLEHLRWAAFKLMYGWEHGDNNKSLKWNKDLVAFEHLPPGEDEKDEMFFDLIPALLRLVWFLQSLR